MVRRVILLEGLVNLLVLGAKVIVGVTTGSFAVLGDAIHSLTDVANNAVAWVVVSLSAQPADREHPYGHRKFETLAVFALSALLAVLAIELAVRALSREQVEIVQDGWGLAIMLGVLCLNVAVATWQRYWARRLNSEILRADASHTFADVLTTIVVIVGWQLSTLGYVWLDTLCALGVSALVLYLAYDLFMRALPVLVDQMSIEPESVIEAALSVPGVRGVSNVRSRWIGSSRAVDMVVTVDSQLSTLDAHAIADALEKLLEQEHQISDISIHIEPQA